MKLCLALALAFVLALVASGCGAGNKKQTQRPQDVARSQSHPPPATSNVTVEDAKKMCRTADRTGQILQVGHQRRYSPDYHHALDLVKKGALKYEEEGNRYLYRPVFTRERFVAQEARSFLQRVFGGDATPALVHFVENVELSDDEIAELRSALERKAKGEKR